MDTAGHLPKTIALAGATGHLGQLIAGYLLQSGASVKALVRSNSPQDVVNGLKKKGAEIIPVDYNNEFQLVSACINVNCLVSALSGVREVMVDAQTLLLNAAVKAGVTRFIPSDYCIDFTKLPPGSNRNLDLRREFAHRLEAAPIAATSILNGMFTDLLIGPAPVVLFKFKRILYWGDARQLMDFTTMDNTAQYTAKAALDDGTPRYLRIAGDVQSNEGLAVAATKAMGQNFKLFRAGSLGMLHNMIKLTKFLFPKNKEVFPPWQGMQYLHNMYTGLPKLQPLNNDRYPGIRWTSVEEVLKRPR